MVMSENFIPNTHRFWFSQDGCNLLMLAAAGGHYEASRGVFRRRRVFLYLFVENIDIIWTFNGMGFTGIYIDI